MDPDQARAANAHSAPQPQAPQGDYELPPELWDAWRCFVHTWHQWRVVAGFAAVWYEGIDQAALLACMEMLEIKRKHRERVFQQVLILERAARELRNKKE